MAKRQRTGTSARARDSKPTRWPWIAGLIVGVFFVTALGVSTSKPTGHGWALTLTLWIARRIASLTGDLAMYLCFLVVPSLVKSPVLKAPSRPVGGLWMLLIALTALWRCQDPWETLSTWPRWAREAHRRLLAWFLRVSLGRFGAIIVILMGMWSGFSLLVNKPAHTPLSVLWLLWLSAWHKIQGFLANLFRPQGPPEEDIECEALEGLEGEPHDIMDDSLLEDGPVSSFSATVSQIQERLANKDVSPGFAADEAAEGEAEDEMPVPQAMEQRPLSEDLFYELPPLSLLDRPQPKKRLQQSQLLEEKAKIIEKTLYSFGVTAKVVDIARGPVATRFELQPGPGVKVSSIVNLSQDLALALAAPDVRIEAPIPGKSAVGIEVPNKDISIVHIRDVLESKPFRNSASPLTIALGKDISGRPVVTTLEKCVHLLIAGATGSGKSVCINSIITSILFKARPDQVKLLLIDPKRVELSAWSQIPHLIAPVVTDPKKASSALRWAIKEMESRYEQFTKVGTRDVDRYNEIATPPGSVKPALPYIVIIIDELSDLMMVAPAEVEDSVFRLAQMARAAGIHLVVATQRPSVDVITGTIKANIPSRIAFAVSSQTDSRTILDMGGAEKLLGRGDMLFFPVGAVKPLRAQGSYISEREIDEIVSFIASQAKPQYVQGVLSVSESATQAPQVQDDPLFAQALRIVVEAKQASVSLLQRRLPIGYSRAARLIDAMELKGYIGPYEGSKPREVKLTMGEYLRLFESQGQTDDIRPEPETDGQAPAPTGVRLKGFMPSAVKGCGSPCTWRALAMAGVTAMGLSGCRQRLTGWAT